MKFLLCFIATRLTAPEPKSGSITIPSANIHGSIYASGNVAKCASFNGFVNTVQIDFLFLLSRIALNASWTYLPLKGPAQFIRKYIR